MLPRVDDDGAGSPMGIHHATALLACQIVSNNAFQGRLYIDRQGQNAVQVGAAEILVEDVYYFFADPTDPNLNYPIVPTFRDWAFPHNQVPTDWAPLTTPTISDLDKCCLSDHEMGLKRPHIVPREEQAWFSSQRMDFIPRLGDINSRRNLLTLRADIHSSYDAKMFAVVPKTGPNGAATYVAHFLGNDDEREVWSLYHNVPLYYASRTMPQRCPRFLIRDDAEQDQQAEDFSGAELFDRYGGGGSPSASPLHPRKRMRQMDGAGDDSDDEGQDGDVFASAVASFEDSFERVEERSRSRSHLYEDSDA